MVTMGFHLRRAHSFILAFILQVGFSSAHFPEVYDFVIVGGGTAGCVLANRLSANERNSVLLLEAGGVPHADLDVPALSSPFLGDPEYTRAYQSVPQDNADRANNGIVAGLVGRTLGGGSSVNVMSFNRGSPNDYNTWARLTNDPSWSYANLLHYFRKVENYAGRFPSDQHGIGGPITITRPNYSPGLETWLSAGRDLGYPNGDPSGPQRVSYTPMEFSKKFGRRVSSYSGYLLPVMSRPNLRVITRAEASRLIFKGNRAFGVRFRVNGTGPGGNGERVVIARKEVILSAGSYESPTILQRSGIGPRDVLQAAKINLIKELPTGLNLQDHPVLSLVFILNNKSMVFDPERDLNPGTRRIYDNYGDGPYSSYGGAVGKAFIQSPASKESNWADLLVHFMAGPADVNPLVSESTGEFSELVDTETTVAASVLLSRPRSRGILSLNSTHPEGPPVVDFQYFSKSSDMEAMLYGISRLLATFENTPSFRKLGGRYPNAPLMACRHAQFRSEEYWKCHVRQLAGSGAHPAGTCRMGSGPQDEKAVVDTSLRVIGVANLRVVDASIMPVVVNANSQAAVYAIAEKAADMILKSWK